MPAQIIAHVVSSLLGVTTIHVAQAFFLRAGFRMGVVRAYPLTLWIKHTGPNGVDREQEWIFLPHAFSIFGKSKSMIGKPPAN